MNTRSNKRQAWEVPEGKSFVWKGENYKVICHGDDEDMTVEDCRGNFIKFNTCCIVDLLEK